MRIADAVCAMGFYLCNLTSAIAVTQVLNSVGAKNATIELAVATP